MARVPKPARPGAWTPPLARIEGDRLLKARQAEQRVREAQAKVEMEARRVEEMESQKLDEKVDDLRTQLNRLTEDLPKILPSGGGGKRMVAKVLARDYPDLTVFEGLAKTDGNFVVANGADWTVESGATARASLGLGNSAVADFATQAEAEAGSGTTQTMSPLRAKQLVDYERTQDRSFTGVQTFYSTSEAATSARVEAENTGLNPGPLLDLLRTSASPAANDYIGGVRFRGIDSAAAEVTYGNVRAQILDPTTTATDSLIEITTAIAGAQVTVAKFYNGMIVGAPTGSYQGTGTVNATGYYLDGTALSSTLFGVAVGSASGNLKVLNADGGFTFDTTTTPTINMGGVFGGTWKAANKKVVTSSGLLTGTYATEVIRWEGEGHNASGATESGLPLFLESKKTDYLTSTTEGQILGTYTNIYGGRLGDHAAHLFGATKVFDGTYSGGLLGIEGSILRKNAANTTTGQTQVYMGFSMSNTGTNFAPDGTVGFCVEPRVGETFAAFAAVERSDLSGPPVFEWGMVGSTSRNNANIFGGMTGTGHAAGAGRFHSSTSAGFPGFSFIGDTDTGVGSPAADQVGLYTNGIARLWATTTNINTSVAPRIFNSTAIPAGGTNGLGYLATSATNFGVFFGSGAPTLTAAKGSLYLRSDGSGTTNRAYINTDGGTTWTALTTAA